MIKSKENGFSLVELLVVVIIIGIIAAIAIPSLLASRRAANEASAISSLRTIHSAEVTHASITAGNSYGTLTSLGPTGDKILDATLGAANPTKSGYTFTEDATAPTTSAYCVSAAPTGGATSTTGTRSFGVDATGVLQFGAAYNTVGCTGTVTGGTVL